MTFQGKANPRSMTAIQERIKAQRLEITGKFMADPWLGYPTLDDALADYKCTTQAEVFARLLNRENVFISGPAGSGKSTLINRFIEFIDAEYQGAFEVALTASTGIAATSINGVTIHSWAGLGISTDPFDPKNIPPMQLGKRQQMRNTDILIIDEISMLPAYLFEKLDAVLKYFRRDSRPFGGVQVVLMGDFLQLPPVDKGEFGVNADFAIATEAWRELNLSYCYMDKTHRASDPRLAEILSKMSRDLIDQDAKDLVNTRMNGRQSKDKVYTTLFTTNRNVDSFNVKSLSENTNRLHKLEAKRTGNAKNVEKIFKTSNVIESIDMKEGATVILTSNTLVNAKLYANGSIGEVLSVRGDTIRIRFNDGESVNIVRKRYALTEKKESVDSLTGKKFVYEVEIASVEQFPVKLGYAITVHKSQGQTLDGVVVDLSQCFTPGLGYVALSRVRSLDDLIVKGISDKAYSVDPKSKKISNYVKKKALKGREEFIAERGLYEMILTSMAWRKTLWDVDQVSSIVNAPRGRR